MQNETGYCLYFPAAACQKKSSSGWAACASWAWAQRGDYSSLTHRHALYTLGTTLSSLPWHKTGKKMPKSSVLKTLLFLPGRPRKGCTRSVSRSLNSLTGAASPLSCCLLSSPDPREHGHAVLASGSELRQGSWCEAGIVCLTPGFLS